LAITQVERVAIAERDRSFDPGTNRRLL